MKKKRRSKKRIRFSRWDYIKAIELAKTYGWEEKGCSCTYNGALEFADALEKALKDIPSVEVDIPFLGDYGLSALEYFSGPRRQIIHLYIELFRSIGTPYM